MDDPEESSVKSRRILVTAATEAFLPGAAALLRSVRCFHPEVARRCFVQAADRAAAERALGGMAEVRTVERPIRGVPEDLQVCVARLAATQFDADVVAYVDSDAILVRPLPLLWNVRPGRVNAVRDLSFEIVNNMPPRYRDAFARQFPMACHDRGINTGVLAFRPADWRALPERFESVLSEGRYQPYTAIMDQPILSALWYGRIDWLPRSYNAHYFYDHGIPWNVRVMHFTGRIKPWMSGFSRRERAYYYWLRYGEESASGRALAGAVLRIALATPGRLAARVVRRTLLERRPLRETLAARRRAAGKEPRS